MKWLPLWGDPTLQPWPEHQPNGLRTTRGWEPNETIFLYSGNMGLGHRFGEFLGAANRLGPIGPRWAFSGSGKRKAEIETFKRTHPSARIEFLDYVPQSRLAEHHSSADVHLASLDSAWQGLMVPSKLQASFAVARPVLFVGGLNCETAEWIRQSGGGWVVGENDPDALLAAIKEAMDPGERQKRGRAALEFARQHFQMSKGCAEMAITLEKACVVH